jgi:hypothetical protein
MARSLSPGTQQSCAAKDDTESLAEGQPSAPGRGAVRSATNPEYITFGKAKSKKNPFFETMPAPEVWHRRMPPFFPFGETPFMERVMSKQINDDLSKGKLILLAIIILLFSRLIRL